MNYLSSDSEQQRRQKGFVREQELIAKYAALHGMERALDFRSWWAKKQYEPDGYEYDVLETPPPYSGFYRDYFIQKHFSRGAESNLVYHLAEDFIGDEIDAEYIEGLLITAKEYGLFMPEALVIFKDRSVITYGPPANGGKYLDVAATHNVASADVLVGSESNKDRAKIIRRWLKRRSKELATGRTLQQPADKQTSASILHTDIVSLGTPERSRNEHYRQMADYEQTVLPARQNIDAIAWDKLQNHVCKAAQQREAQETVRVWREEAKKPKKVSSLLIAPLWREISLRRSGRLIMNLREPGMLRVMRQVCTGEGNSQYLPERFADAEQQKRLWARALKAKNPTTASLFGAAKYETIISSARTETSASLLTQFENGKEVSVVEQQFIADELNHASRILTANFFYENHNSGGLSENLLALTPKELGKLLGSKDYFERCWQQFHIPESPATTINAKNKIRKVSGVPKAAANIIALGIDATGALALAGQYAPQIFWPDKAYTTDAQALAAWANYLFSWMWNPAPLYATRWEAEFDEDNAYYNAPDRTALLDGLDELLKRLAPLLDIESRAEILFADEPAEERRRLWWRTRWGAARMGRWIRWRRLPAAQQLVQALSTVRFTHAVNESLETTEALDIAYAYNSSKEPERFRMLFEDMRQTLPIERPKLLTLLEQFKDIKDFPLGELLSLEQFVASGQFHLGSLPAKFPQLRFPGLVDKHTIGNEVGPEFWRKMCHTVSPAIRWAWKSYNTIALALGYEPAPKTWREEDGNIIWDDTVSTVADDQNIPSSTQTSQKPTQHTTRQLQTTQVVFRNGFTVEDADRLAQAVELVDEDGNYKGLPGKAPSRLCGFYWQLRAAEKMGGSLESLRDFFALRYLKRQISSKPDATYQTAKDMIEDTKRELKRLIPMINPG